MKQIIFIIIFSLLSAISFAEEIATVEEISYEEGCGKNYSALIYEEKTNNILFQKRADIASYPASLVKMMTLYLVFEAIENEKLHPDQVLLTSERGEEIAAVNKINTMKLKVGDAITVHKAIRAVIVKSFNEAAVTLAEAVSGSEWSFVRKMNIKAAELGMMNSSFKNATGLHEEGQYTNAYDLARLTRAIKKDFPQYYHLFSKRDFSYNDIKYKTHNHVLASYKGAEGMKTGFTNASGFNLISVAKKDNKRIVSILLGCESYQIRDKFTKIMLDDAFKKTCQNPKSKISAKLGLNFEYDKNILETNDYEDEMRFGE